MNKQNSAVRANPAAPDLPIPIRERQRQQTRDVILDVALADIADLGLSGIRIEHIARKSGVTRPTVYAHFPTREDFLRELQARTESSALLALQERLELDTGPSLLHGQSGNLIDPLPEARGPKPCSH